MERASLEVRDVGSAWWVEAIVWVLGACGAALLLLQARSDGLRVLGAVVIAAIGFRAVIRVVRLAIAHPLRTLRVMLGTPMPSVSGPTKTIPLNQAVRFGVSFS